MPEEGFLRRWARVKATGATEQDDAQAEAAARPAPAAPAPASAPAPAAWPWGRAGDVGVVPAAPVHEAAPAGEAAEAGGPAAPTLEDVARLTPESDYSIFVGKGVDKSVQRLALKKLFADPHFNVMDRLDMYMDDYNIPSPVSEEMLASLDHARSALRRFVEEAPASTADPAVTAGEAGSAALADLPAGAAPAQGTLPVSTEAPTPADDRATGVAGNDALPHNEAAHAAVHRDSLPREACDAASTHEHGTFHRPNQQLSQGQV